MLCCVVGGGGWMDEKGRGTDSLVVMSFLDGCF
jgi:hypothetical protein